MLSQWTDFYLLVGSAGSALIGLLFVVATLTSGRDRSTALRGAKLYMSPLVFQLVIVFLVSAAASAPHVDLSLFGAIVAAAAAIGLVISVRVLTGMRKKSSLPAPHWTDIWFYGFAPLAAFVALGAVAAAVFTRQAWGLAGVAIVTTLLLLLAIRNAWDLVTWLAPGAEQDDK